MVLEAGIEPARLSAGDFKSPVYTYFTTRAFVLIIHSLKSVSIYLAYPQGLEPRPTVLETVMLPLH